MAWFGSAKGNASYWQHFWLPQFKGPGEYVDEDGYRVVIEKAERVPPPPTKALPVGAVGPHWTAQEYGYGQMFRGDFYRKELDSA